MKNSILTFLLILLSVFETAMGANFKAPIKAVTLRSYEERRYEQEYENLISFIKKHEGFSEKPYICKGGYSTIGHGLRTSYIPSKFRHSITLHQSDSLIREKINNGIITSKSKYSKLNNFQHLAVSHLYFCKGVGRVTKHSIHRELKNGILNKHTLLYFSPVEEKNVSYRKTREYEYKLYLK